MTIENWLTTGVIIATLIGPSVAEFVKSRLNQPKASPDLNQPTPRIRRIGNWLANILQSPWYLPGFLILSNSYFLRQQLLSTAPLTRHEVFNICSSVAGIFYAIMLMSFSNVWKQQREINARQQDILAEQAQTDRTLCSVLNTHMKIIGLTVDDLHTTAENIHLILEGQDERRQTEVLRARLTELEATGRLRKKGVRR
jgi:hypothetical protein